ncbi:MAG: hypothetical protein LC099_07475 [Anaerolineales bacterium]|nr:hypothetical protein [Anaerolineales bacterium]
MSTLTLTEVPTAEETSAPPPLPAENSTPPISASPTESLVSQSETPSASTETLIYDDGKNVVAINSATGATQILISRDELKFIFGEDKSAQSYTYEKEIPFQISLSPNLKEALISFCSILDSKFRCSNEYFIYSLEEKTAIRLPKPDAYGAYWVWSPDSSKLAGASWTYNAADYELLRFYSVNHDGTNLVALSAVTNDNWQTDWHPGSGAILPLTYAANFRSILADGSGEPDIFVSGLAQNDKIRCLSFSPDFNRVAFLVHQDGDLDRNRIYVARSDFAEVSLIAEYPMDARYLCDMQWSSDQRFVSIEGHADARAEVGAKQNNLATQSALINLEANSVSPVSQNAFACGWTPNNELIYEDETSVALFDPTTLQSSALPEALTSLVKHCPLQWLKSAPALNIPQGLPVRNACHPGGEITDDQKENAALSPLFDVLSVSSSLDDETLSVTFHSAAASKNLNDFLSPGVPEPYLNGWEVLIDSDNNFLSGDKVGTDYRFSVGVKPRPNGNPPGLAGVILKFDADKKTYVPIEALQMLYDPDAATLTLTGKIPGITQISRLVFLSRVVSGMNGSTPNVGGDRLCD